MTKRAEYLEFKYAGANPAGLGRQYAKALLAGRIDIVTDIDLFVFEVGGLSDAAIDKFCAFADCETEDQVDGVFEDEEISGMMLAANIKPVFYGPAELTEFRQ